MPLPDEAQAAIAGDDDAEDSDCKSKLCLKCGLISACLSVHFVGFCAISRTRGWLSMRRSVHSAAF